MNIADDAREDVLKAELRRQGRAAIGAQAAAEACLEAVQALSERVGSMRDAMDAQAADNGAATARGDWVASPGLDDPTAGARLARDRAWCDALMPVVDAVERMARAAAVASQPAPRRWSWLPSGSGSGPSPDTGLRDGVGVLHSLLEQALRSLGVTLERRVGVPMDPERHRVVELRPAQDVPSETVLEVLRPAWIRGGQVLREADVVMAANVNARKGKGPT